MDENTTGIYLCRFNVKSMYFTSDLGMIFLSQDRFSGRKDVTSDKVNFIPDIRQNVFLKKSRTSRVCVALKTMRRYCNVKNNKHR